MTSIFERVSQDLHIHHHDQENPVTTPAQPNIFADASAALGRISTALLTIGGNQLITRLIGEKLGHNLTGDDIEHVVAVIRSFEGSRAATAGPLPQRTPQPVTPAGTAPQPVQQ